MTIKGRWCIPASLVAAIALGQAAMAQETLRIAATLPDGNAVVQQVFDPWAEHVNAADVGIRVDIVKGATIADGRNVLDRVIDGIVDGGWILPGYSGKPFPKTSVVGLPFVSMTASGATAGLDALREAGMLDDEYSSVTILGLAGIPTNLLHTKEPVESLEDAGGLKLRVADRAGSDIASAIGGSGISMQITESYQGLSQGVVDGIVTGWTGLYVFKLQEVVGHHTEVPLGQQAAGIFLNNEVWAGLTPEQQEVLRSAPGGVSLSQFIGDWYTESDLFFRSRVLEAGGQLHELSPEESAKFEAALQPVVDGWIANTESGAEVLEIYKKGVATIE